MEIGRIKTVVMAARYGTDAYQIISRPEPLQQYLMSFDLTDIKIEFVEFLIGYMPYTHALKVTVPNAPQLGTMIFLAEMY